MRYELQELNIKYEELEERKDQGKQAAQKVVDDASSKKEASKRIPTELVAEQD